MTLIEQSPNCETSTEGPFGGGIVTTTKETAFNNPIPTDSPMAEDWWMHARCRETLDAGDLFFSEGLAEIAAAKRICAECPVIAPCLEGAIGRGEPCGVWGGQLFEKGRIVMIKRKRGRPPKHPRPEDQVPLVPIPEHLQRLIA